MLVATAHSDQELISLFDDLSHPWLIRGYEVLVVSLHDALLQLIRIGRVVTPVVRLPGDIVVSEDQVVRLLAWLNSH